MSPKTDERGPTIDLGTKNKGWVAKVKLLQHLDSLLFAYQRVKQCETVFQSLIVLRLLPTRNKV